MLLASAGVVPLWPERIFASGQEVVEERSLDEMCPDRSYSGRYSPQLFLSWPENPIRQAPAVLICPGGGYIKVCLDKEGFELARWFNDLGLAAAVLKYRLPSPGEPGVPAPIQDAVQAMRLLRANAEKWGLDTRCVGIVGASAGGHLAATVATRFAEFGAPAEVRPDFQMLLYPVIRFHDSSTAHMGSCEALLGAGASEAQREQFSVDRTVTRETPPAFLVHAEDDVSVPLGNSRSYLRALEAAGVPVRLMVVPTGGHGFGLGRKGGGPEAWPPIGAGWLRETIHRLQTPKPVLAS